MLRLFTITVAVGVLASAAAAQQPAEVSAPEPTTNSDGTADTIGRDDPTKVICRSVRPPTGTRVTSARTRQKVCLTREQWDQQAREAQEALKVRDSGVCSPGECSG
jgi:hypothetical protein